MKFSEKYLEKVKSLVKPVNHFETLAKDGFLNEYIKDFFYDKYMNDIEFRENVMIIQQEYSQEAVEEINNEYLAALSNELTNFIEKNEK
ncbi:MAG: hypothetical protein CVV25_06025 [Ignavibacteriae bacterium HGW-Ignavibacteriae-4]|jgi:hypothetical protein|nr:MAG: hypothetical protein CVV25_06025 [Ignavibacteriae bacterium HGW-Ignavibacteriae-4]